VQAIRAFIAIDIPSHIRRIIGNAQSGFKILGLDAKWVASENIHLTLKFLGAIDSTQVSLVGEVLRKSLSHLPRFRVSLGEVGAFPNTSRPRILWIGLEAPGRIIESLQQVVEEEMFRLGFPRENKSFLPHLTLARIKSNKNTDRLETVAFAKPEAEPFTVESVKLYQSQLTPKGSIYTILQEFPLHMTGAGA
jgi:2'-5' RNA ligase